MNIRFIFFLPLLFFANLLSSQNVGIFEQHQDVGNVLHKGSTVFNNNKEEYLVSGAGKNIWFSSDEFQFAWKKLKGDFILQAKVSFIGKGVEAHRKAGWMVRNSTDTSSPMVIATIHGDGLTSLQYRKVLGANVEQVESAINMPDMIQLQRKGNVYTMAVAKFGDPFTISEIKEIKLNEEVYVGLFVCSHNSKVLENAIFSNVRIIIPAKDDYVPYRDYIGSHIEELDVFTGERKILYSEPRSLQAPNWTVDNKALIYNSEGLIYRLDLATRKNKVVPTDFVVQNNNDHVISFDGKWIGLSSSSGEAGYGSLVYVVPLKGGKPRRVTPIGPSYLHGFSPDGKWMTYTGGRNKEWDIYKILVDGGEEIRLTNSPGLDDGSEYSPDGKFIYFNSTRSGLMQIWRMKPDGSQQELVTNDEFNNWFPHISPDGKWIVFLSFGQDVKPDDHPFYKQVYLRMIPINGGPSKVIAYLYGGQSSINTPSWSPNSRKIAFVSNSDMK